MTTNQTIDGVPRRLLDRMHSCARGLEASEWAELRALLDGPVKKRPAWMDEPFAVAARGEERGSSHGFEQSPNTCRHDDRSGVWWREGSITRTGRECCACGSVEEDPVEPAAQPQGEPVARLGVHHVLGAIHNVPGFPGVKGNHIHDLTALLNGVLTEAGQPAPVAVVLPERREPAQDNPYLTDADHEWNACLDATAALNGPVK